MAQLEFDLWVEEVITEHDMMVRKDLTYRLMKDRIYDTNSIVVLSSPYHSGYTVRYKI